jgi:hypothetical protein
VRYLIAWRHELALDLLGIFADAVGSFYRQQARDQGIADGRAGMVSVIQRFGGSLNLNPHFHLTALDGVFEKTSDGLLAFHEAPMPSHKDITVLCSVVRYRTLALLRKRGFLGPDADADPFADDEPLLASIAGASLCSRIATGERAGRPVLRLATVPPEVQTRKAERGAHIDGFDLHAGAALAATDRKAIEALLRYQLRPPLAKARLARLPDGRLRLGLRTPYHDGTTHLVLTPHELLERLAALVPRPQKNLIIYHGCLAPRARDRDEVVAFGRPVALRPREPLEPAFDFELIDDHDGEPPRRSSRHSTWAELQARVWGSSVLRCPRCQASLRLVALVTAPFAIRAILSHIGLATGPRKPPLPLPPCQLLLFAPDELRPRLAVPAPCRSPPLASTPHNPAPR